MSTSPKHSPLDASSKDKRNYSSLNRHDNNNNNNNSINDGRKADAFKRSEFDGYLTFDSDRTKDHDIIYSNPYRRRGGHHHHHHHASDVTYDDMGYINLSAKNTDQTLSPVDNNTSSSSMVNKRYMFRKQPSVLLSNNTVRESLITVIEIYEETVNEKGGDSSNQKQRKKILQDEKRMNRDQLLQEARQNVIFDPKYDADQDAKSNSPSIKATASHSSESSSSSTSKSEKKKSTSDPAYKSRHYFKRQAETKNVLQGVILAR